MPNDINNDENLFVGRNAVAELLAGKRTADKILVQKGLREGSLAALCAKAAAAGIPVVEADKRKLDELACGIPHQGIAAYASATVYCDIDDILRTAEEKGEKPFIIICDSVGDPHNLGAIIRTAECAGAHGVIIPKRRGVSVNGTVAKASAGAVFHMNVARVANLASAVSELKEKGIWVWAAEADGTPYYTSDFDCGCAFILGGEDEGVSRLLKERADFVVSIPMFGSINSLNVSAAAAILMFEAAKQRNAGKNR